MVDEALDGCVSGGFVEAAFASDDVAHCVGGVGVFGEVVA